MANTGDVRPEPQGTPMSSYERSAVVQTRFYSLLEAGSLVGVSVADLLRLAANNLLEVSVLVPAGRRAFAVDPGSLILWDSRALHERFFTRAVPNKEKGMPARKDDLAALILNWAQCQDLEDFGFSRQLLFSAGYSVMSGRSLAGASDPMKVRPVRMPLFTNDGSKPTDQSQWRFALYPYSTMFVFTEGAGYPEPEDLLITIDSLRILGRELSRLPKPIDLSPPDVDIEFAQRPSTARDSSARRDAVTDVELEEPGLVSVEPVRPAGPKEKKAEPAARPDHTVSETEPADVVLAKAEVVREDRGPIVLLPREEVERRINKGKSWIYERIKKTHPNFDPTFPQPIKIGGSVGWIEAEIEAWNQEQIRKVRGS